MSVRTRALLFLAVAPAVVVLLAAPGVRAQRGQAPRYASTIVVYDFATRASTALHHADAVWEAPNWSRNGRFLLSNSGGRLYRVPVDGGEPVALALDESLRANNDHDFSPDGRQLAFSASSATSRGSQVYVANADGTNARLVVPETPSYFHGWSPDGRYLTVVANRDGQQYDLYRVLATGGPQERLTSDPAYDDGTDYSPDGRWIYFNSDRGGGWNIWRMPADGAGPNDARAEQVTNDDREDWFPHPSPDGRHLLFVSFPPGTETHNDRDKAVQIRMIPLPGDALTPSTPDVVVELTGGQGTMNVNSWSPDSTKFAYVAYEKR
jgi:Tol biopolymer transport system component